MAQPPGKGHEAHERHRAVRVDQHLRIQIELLTTVDEHEKQPVRECLDRGRGRRLGRRWDRRAALPAVDASGGLARGHPLLGENLRERALDAPFGVRGKLLLDGEDAGTL